LSEKVEEFQQRWIEEDLIGARDDPVGIGTTDDPSCVDMVREDPPIDESLSTIWKILHRAKIVVNIWPRM
jgi:hypothetical protein